jgi:polyketide cyclase/dehydrase/lipid transport protein
MANWTATTTSKATPEQILEVLTHPDEIRRWSPIDFDLEDLNDSRLAAGTRARVTGRIAGVSMGFDVEVRAADEELLELSADGPIGIDVRYELAPLDIGSEVVASVGIRRGGGLTGRLVANATAALLSAGVLEGAAGRIARAAEQQPEPAFALAA